MSLDANANYICHVPADCACMECHKNSHLQVSNTIVQPAELFLKAEKLISELHIPNHINTFHELKCKTARNPVAGFKLEGAIKYCICSRNKPKRRIIIGFPIFI